jgi:hypothetical protein
MTQKLWQPSGRLLLLSSFMMKCRLSVNSRVYLSTQLVESMLPLRRRYLARCKRSSKSASLTSQEASPIINIISLCALLDTAQYHELFSEVRPIILLQSIAMTFSNFTKHLSLFPYKMALFWLQTFKDTQLATLDLRLPTLPN